MPVHVYEKLDAGSR